MTLSEFLNYQKYLIWPYVTWRCGIDKIWIRPDLTGSDQIRSDCSFRFVDITWCSIWFSVFVKNSNGISKFLLVCLQSEWQLNASTNLKQPRNANVIWEECMTEIIFGCWLNIIGICWRSCTLNSTWDFEFAMWSTWVVASATEEAQGP